MRFAVSRKSNTDPDVATTAAMLSALHTAADSTIGKRPAAGAACFARPFWDFDRFLVAMLNPLRGSGCVCGLTPDASLSKLIFDRSPPSHEPRLKTLITVVNRK
jgi:hypothetical protein